MNSVKSTKERDEEGRDLAAESGGNRHLNTESDYVDADKINNSSKLQVQNLYTTKATEESSNIN